MNQVLTGHFFWLFHTCQVKQRRSNVCQDAIIELVFLMLGADEDTRNVIGRMCRIGFACTRVLHLFRIAMKAVDCTALTVLLWHISVNNTNGAMSEIGKK